MMPHNESPLFKRRSLLLKDYNDEIQDNKNARKPFQQTSEHFRRTRSKPSRISEERSNRQILPHGGLNMDNNKERIEEILQEKPELKNHLPPLYQQVVEQVVS